MPSFDSSARFLRTAFLAQRHLVELLAFVAHQTGIKALPLMLHLRGDRPIFLRPESFDLAITFDDQAERD